MSSAIIVFCTAPDEACAQQLADKVLTEKLAACVTLLPGALSCYHWQGEIQRQREVQLVLKSDTEHQQSLLECLKASHPYQVPELVVVPVTYGDNHYLSWLSASLS